MYIEQMYTSCLSEAAYYIESNGEVAIIDPLRDTEVYTQKAKERNATIKYIFETHFHADFVSGHIDLAQKTGAQIIYGPNAHTEYKVYNAKDKEVFELGKLQIKALHTPGHTMESTCYLLLDEAGNENAIFTGDTLFVGDVGRPDLFGGTYTKEHLATLMYHSLQIKILPLPDHVIVYPAHGPGSSCGKNLGPNTFSTIGEQKATNYALAPQTVEDFVTTVTSGLTTPPAYFPFNAKVNKEGYDSLDIVIKQSLIPMSVNDFELASQDDVIILDTRPATIFTQGFVPNSVFVGLEGRFAEWVGTILPNNKPILLVTAIGKELETITRLSRIGYDNVIGYLDGSFEAWQNANKSCDLIIDVEADELAMDMNYDENLIVIDVRKEAEFEDAHIQGALLTPLNTFTDLITFANVEENENLYVHCAGGYRSVIACSLYKAQGIHNIRNVLGGWAKIKLEKNIPIVVASATLN